MRVRCEVNIYVVYAVGKLLYTKVTIFDVYYHLTYSYVHEGSCGQQ